jgi:Pentapeptide repeats (8 copies)
LHVLKSWAAWPSGVRWLAGGIAAAVLALAVAWAMFVPAADWLAHHDIGSATGPLHETALDNARGRLLTLGAGLFAAGALIFTAQNFIISRRTFELTEQGHVTDRYTKAVEQLGGRKPDVRIGGIYALERVARDSARDHPAVMEVLTAFVREHSPVSMRPPRPDGAEPERSPRADVQAALTVVGRLTMLGRGDPKRDIRPIDLSGAALADAKLPHGAHLVGAKLAGVNLSGVDLGGADLTRADLTEAILIRAVLGPVELTDAELAEAELPRSARSVATKLVDADLMGSSPDRNNSRTDPRHVHGPGGGVKMAWVPMRRQMMCGWPGTRSAP